MVLVKISRQDALYSGKTRYYTGMPCKHGHVTERFSTSGGCVDCVNPKVRMTTRRGFKLWKPAKPLMVPDWIDPQPERHGDSLHQAMQESLDAVMVQWMASWGWSDKIESYFPGKGAPQNLEKENT